MTVFAPLARMLVRQALPQSNSFVTRLASTNSILHASRSNAGLPTVSQAWQQEYLRSKIGSFRAREYATTTAAKPRGRPKAHTGRATAQKTSSTRPARQATAGRPVKETKAKAKPKAKSKPKPKPKSKLRKRATSKASIRRDQVAKRKDLKNRALLNEPKRLPDNPWLVYMAENRRSVKTIAEQRVMVSELSQKYRTLAPEEREHLNHTSNQNKRKNEVQHKEWLSQYTPAEINDANTARNTLSKQKKVKGGKKSAPVKKIQDERIVKRHRTSYSYFVKDRFASGDFRHMKLTESSKLIGREWKALSKDEKKPYNDQQEADIARYVEEAASVYGKAPSPTRAKTSSSAA